MQCCWPVLKLGSLNPETSAQTIRLPCPPPRLLSTKYIIEGLRTKRTYIGFWPIFIFCWIELIFHRLTCFDMKRIVPQLSWWICASFSRNNICKKTQFSSNDLLFNEKQKKPFVSLSFIICIITQISYCCFVSASN